MEEGILTPEKEPDLIRNAIEQYITPRGYKDVRANIEDFETPSHLKSHQKKRTFIPDITGLMNGRKNYFEISVKTDKVRQMVTKWQLLSKVAQLKQGKLVLLVPSGNLAFTKRLLKKYPIEAQVVKLS